MTIKLFELDKKLEIARCGQLSPIIDGKSTLAHVENSISAQKRQIAVLPVRSSAPKIEFQDRPRGAHSDLSTGTERTKTNIIANSDDASDGPGTVV